MTTKQIEFYENKLAYEIDPADLFEAINQGEQVIPLDVRQIFGYEKEHLPNALNLPHRNITEDSTRHLDKSIVYVCYCDGIGCNASTYGALKLTKLGFKVKELIGGIEWWKFDGYGTKGKNATPGQAINCAC